MTHLGLFEGIGGFSLAARWMGWETIAWCEINPFCQKVLSYHFPKAQKHGDITKTDFTIYNGKCDILTGGFPCQPFSGAGKQLGEGDERYLFQEMLRAIREIKPKWIVAENVYGLTTSKIRELYENIFSSLEIEGYKTLPVHIPASAVGAPHIRERVWIIAYSGEEQFYAIKPKDRSVKINGFQKKIGGNSWDKFNLGTPIGHTTSDFYNGDDFEPAIIRVDDGISSQLDELEAYGNAIVPQVALEIFKAIEQYENSINL